jgi:hypothetical protein
VARPSNAVETDETLEGDIQANVQFAILVHAKRVSDFQRAADALSALEALGIKVRFLRGHKPTAARPQTPEPEATRQEDSTSTAG